MSNPIPDAMHTGKMGELLVQLRLLQYGVQAAPPLEDTGNDLIAVRGEILRTIQIKTSKHYKPDWPSLQKLFRIVAIVFLAGDDTGIWLDKSDVFLVPRDQLEAAKTEVAKKGNGALEPFRISQALVDRLFHDATTLPLSN